jgi:iron complex transport system ATP-binding protein
MLKAEHITYKTGGRVLLNDVSAEFRPGLLNLVIGPNGAGKSTLIKILCNQLRPEQGTVWYGEKNSRELSAAALARMRGVLSQHIELSFPLTAREVVMMGRYPHFTGKPAARDESACEAAMRFFDVPELAGQNYMTLSGGEKQRVNFARVMAQIWYPPETGNRYLLLDEPLTFLDIHYQFQFMRKLTSLLEDPKLVVAGVVHDLNLAARFAGHIILLHEGRVLAAGDSDTVLSKTNIRTAYQLEPVIHRENGHLQLFFQ